jgi:hypothetical protein
MRSPRPNDLQALLLKWRKRFWLAMAIAVFLAGDAALWTFGPPAFVASVLRALIAGETPTIATAASFSVSAGSFSTQNRAAAFAGALDASGLPILVRARPEDGRYQVLVGPYVSTDEAEQAQRGLAAWGLGEARLVVDDTMRSRPQRAAMFGGGDGGSDGVLIVAAPGMSSVVFEMTSAPREVESRRTSATTLDIDIGHVTGAGQRNVLSMPEGVVLARELSVEAAGTDRAMRAHLVVPEGVQSRLRLEGRRVYVDLAWPQPPWQVGTRASRATQDARASAQPNDGRLGEEQSEAYREQLRTAVERFEQIQPFLISAVESPEPEVRAALAHTLEGVRESLAGAAPPSDLAANYQMLSSSIALASSAMAPSFAGDGMAAARQAIAMFEAARK